MPAGLGGAGWVALTLETVMGTYLDPSTAGTVWIPILSESLAYTEAKYYSSAIKQQTIVTDVKQGYYHVEGDLEVEADPSFLPYLLHCSRHTITKTGVGPYVYKYAPSQAGSASTAASGNVARTCSLTVVRNGVGFGYAGCVMQTIQATITDGVLRFTFGVLGLSETDPAALGTPAWVAANLFGADAHTISVDAAGTAPAFAAPDLTFNGYTFNANYNGSPQNRIRSDRSASYISYGETEATYSTEIDFLNKTEYTNFKNSTTRAIRLASLHPGSAANLAAATDGVVIDVNRSTYNSYGANLPGMGDLVMATVEGRALGIAGGDPFSISVKSAVSIL